MKMSQLKPDLLVQTPSRLVLKVHEVVSRQKVLAEAVYPLPVQQPALRIYTSLRVEKWKPVTPRMLHKYQGAHGLTRTSEEDR